MWCKKCGGHTGGPLPTRAVEIIIDNEGFCECDQPEYDEKKEKK